MTAKKLLLLYASFAVLSTGVNLAVQRVVLIWGAGSGMLMLAMACGTLCGLVVKYHLDRRWIFQDQGRGAAHHGRTFFLYSLMGVATTALFWITETVFWLTWGTDAAREAGATLGLAAGYAAKYQLDRKYVFSGSAAEADR